MNQKSERVFSSGQQNKFRQLQQEVSALEEQLQDALLKQLPVSDRDTYSPIPLPRVSHGTAQTGIKLAHNRELKTFNSGVVESRYDSIISATKQINQKAKS